MGVPKFYRWISERYPKINQIVSDNALLPEFDHCYLDMNGIIHGCTHPSDQDISNVISERDMMLGILQYLDRIITHIVKPKVSVFMAIDGVAPRAKLNQQRSRRFRSAKDMAEATKDLPLDEKGQKQEVFDSNCITPGTEFLAKVSDVIRYFIRKKLKEDPQWHGLQVIFSGHDIPGEGEHKIMSHIREMRAQPHYRPNTRHCIYGQDADLIMLGLVTHEPHFTILREVVDFSFNNNTKNSLKAVKKFTKESGFQLLHLSVLREYLQIEFSANTAGAPQHTHPVFDLERVVDDFVFMTFLVGNDFLPHMPTLDIGDGAFDLLFSIYKEQRLTWGSNNCYLVELGEISDPVRLETFLAAIGAVETDILEQREKDDALYLKKRRKWDKRDGKEGGPTDLQLKEAEEAKQADYETVMHVILSKHCSEDFVDGWSPPAETSGEKDFKGRYYYEKMKLTPVDKEEHWNLRRSYMEGLRWCLAYYYRGCISWGWFYPYHYGPMLSDLINIPKMFDEIRFEMGEPLKPFEQLMGCLPPASSELVPKLYRWLMTSPESPISAFYPIDFEVDMNGKKNPWEGVNLLPFIDIKLLKDTIEKHCPAGRLSVAERQRNAMGKVFRYKYDVTCTDIVQSPIKKIGLPDIMGSHSSVDIIEPNNIAAEVDLTFKPELVPGTQIPYPGFPSLNVLPIASVELTQVGLNCFGSPSKYPNTILTLHQMPELPPIEQLAENVLGKSLFVNWPMMHEGKVVAISNEMKEIRLVKGKLKAKEHNRAESDRWRADAEIMSQNYYAGNGRIGSGGVQIGEVKLRLKLLPLQGMKTNASNGSKVKVFGKEEADIPLQLALWQAPAPDPRFVERGPMTLEDRFPAGCSVVLTKGKFRGCLGTVVGVADKKTVGVKVQTVPPEMPFGLAIARSIQDSYVSSADAARILRIHPGVLGKVMGRLQFEQGRYDLGLNLKSADGACVIGYTRKKLSEKKVQNGEEDAWAAGDSVLVVGSRTETADEDEQEERVQWEYTPKAIRLVEAYRHQFPKLFAAMNKKPNERRYDANSVFGPNGEAFLPVVREWLDKHESAKLPRSPLTTESMSVEASAAVQKAADVRTLALKKKGFPHESLVKIPGSALYREGSTGATDVLLSSDLNDDARPELGDRVVNLCADGVPFGLRGTVVGIHEAATSGSVEVLMDEEFIGGTTLQGHCANFRGKLCLWSHLLRIAPDNSKGLVDKLVPKGLQRAAMDQAVSEIIASSETTNRKSSWDSQVDAAASRNVSADTTSSRPISAARTKSKTPPRSSSRADSTGRNRVAWREARGPDEKGVGFKCANMRNKTSGLGRWDKSLKAKRTSDSVDQTAAELKKMLGLSSPQSNPPPYGTQLDPVAQQLKAMLGVDTTKRQKVPAAVPQGIKPSASEGLKAMLGVQSEADAPPQVLRHQQPTRPPTAADKLLQMMAGKQPQFPNFPQAPPSSFNFTYVEEGKEPPPRRQPPAMALPYPNFPVYPTALPVPMHTMPFYPGYGSPPPPNSTPPFGVAPPGPPPDQFPPLGAANAVDFPPLGSTKPEKVATPATKEKKQIKAPTIMVPSAVAGRH